MAKQNIRFRLRHYADRWAWRAEAGGNVLAVSMRTYSRKHDAKRACVKFQAAMLAIHGYTIDWHWFMDRIVETER